MRNNAIRIVGAALLAAVLLAVGGPVTAKHLSAWGTPVKLGPQINFDNSMESCPTFVKGGLAFYYASNITGGPGNRDIYVVRRAHLDEPWGKPVRLNENINTSIDERCPYVTPDGRRLIFIRPEGKFNRFYMSVLKGDKDDLNWGIPVRLDILSSDNTDYALTGFEDEHGRLTMYFGSTRTGFGDIYQTTMDKHGNFTPPVPVTELNDPNALDIEPGVTRDGLEMYFTSSRPGGVGGWDIWLSTRHSTSQPWGAPVNMGDAINSPGMDMRPAISWQGDTMIFSSGRSGMLDLYQSTRSKMTGPKER
jgi:hypothetical protein